MKDRRARAAAAPYEASATAADQGDADGEGSRVNHRPRQHCSSKMTPSFPTDDTADGAAAFLIRRGHRVQ